MSTPNNYYPPSTAPVQTESAPIGAPIANRITVCGHSLALGSGSKIAASDQRFGMLTGAPPPTAATGSSGYRGIRNFAVGSSVLQLDDQTDTGTPRVNHGGFGQKLASIPTNGSASPAIGAQLGYGFNVPDTTVDVNWWGINDLGLMGNNARALNCFENAMTCAVLAGRMNSYIKDSSAAVVNKTSGATVIAPAAASGYNFGTTATLLPAGATSVLTLPASHPGGFVTANLIGYQGLGAPTVTAVLNGRTLATRTINDTLDYPAFTIRVSFGPVPFRFYVPPGGGAITLTTTAPVYLDAYVIDARYAPLTILPSVHLPFNPSFYGPTLTATDVAAYNNVLAHVAAVIDPYNIWVTDTNAALAGATGVPDSTLFIPDGLHPNDDGHARIAAGWFNAYHRWSSSLPTLRKAQTL